VLRAVHEAGDDAGLNGDDREPVGLHDLGHSFVAIALQSGMTLPEASALARHANPRITAMAYAGLTDDARAKLGEKLAAAFGANLH
jgi:integrase